MTSIGRINCRLAVDLFSISVLFISHFYSLFILIYFFFYLYLLFIFAFVRIFSERVVYVCVYLRVYLHSTNGGQKLSAHFQRRCFKICVGVHINKLQK